MNYLGSRVGSCLAGLIAATSLHWWWVLAIMGWTTLGLAYAATEGPLPERFIEGS